ncbi:MAG: hypothetical protein J7545_23015 [Roseofilum sp. SBFL]|uniref:hypothetical protein n=1 Tax=unclassified Roseofilum TaxID=2620099 RepID=UPI001B041A77|nr:MULTISPECIES: hypothetical protein [unclassified Roseofilum]MBP0044808.1 hypothetical protein [Roseofilum sp. SBFL]
MNTNPNNQPQPAKKIWLAPELNKIAVRETESGPLGVSVESLACSDPVPTPS